MTDEQPEQPAQPDQPDRAWAVAWGAATDVGRVRTSNEDSFVAESAVFGVADGMGGHQIG